MTPQFRNPLVAVLVLSIACLASALYLQESKNWFPCALCVMQRYAYLGTAFFALMALVLGNTGWQTMARACVALAVLAGFAGLGTAGYHVWVLSNPGATCGVDPLQIKLNALAWTGWWPMMFEADGLCTAEYPPFLGLDLPAWSAIGFVIQLGLLLKAALSVAQKPSQSARPSSHA
jgi:disulfide bond formation protein DsbB